MSIPKLPSDIERALQHAVGQANKAYTDSEGVAAEKRSKKKKRGSDEADGEEVRRKRRKEIPGEDTTNIPEPKNPASAGAFALPADGVSKKNKKREKGKDRALHHLAAPTSAAIAHTPSSDAFVDAVVNAASQVSQNTPNFLPPSSSAAVSVPDLFAGSAEDMMDMLQSLDMASLSDIMKGVSSSAQASNVTLEDLNGPASSLLAYASSHGPTTSSARTSSAARPLPGHAKSTRQKKATGSETIVDLITLDDADILATKWLTSKDLNELAHNRGVCTLPHLHCPLLTYR
jgi:hypothetical protein